MLIEDPPDNDDFSDSQDFENEDDASDDEVPTAQPVRNETAPVLKLMGGWPTGSNRDFWDPAGNDRLRQESWSDEDTDNDEDEY